jgi:hypothetical protein
MAWMYLTKFRCCHCDSGVFRGSYQKDSFLISETKVFMKEA